MTGVYRASVVPILLQDGKVEVDNNAKADMLVKAFQAVHNLKT